MRKICARLYFFPQCAICKQDLRKIVLLSPMRNICTRFVQDGTSLPNGHCTLFFIRNSFIRNLYWGGQIAKKLSVLKPQRLKNFFFFHFQYHNFEDTVTNLIKTCSEKNLFVVQTLTVNRISHLKVSLFVFNYKTMFSFAYGSISRKY